MMSELSEDQQAALAEVRAAIHRHYPVEATPDHVRRIDLVAQGERMLGHLETWLLDEEQKQMLQLHPWDVFLLHAAAYLCDIGLVGEDGDGATPKTALRQRYSDPGRLAQVNQISHAVILHHGTHLGLGDTAISNTVAEISRQAGVLTGEDAMPPEAEMPVMDHAPVNIPLLAGAIRLAHALDLKARSTAYQVCQYLPQPHAMTFETYDRSLDVIGVGPHPYLPGTIQVKLCCSDAELHRALKRHERAVQHLLDQSNRQIHPRFLFSEVIYEIEPQGYVPADLKFSVDSSAALHLFTGNRLYADNRVFLRELIQNAVDACNLRKLFDEPYVPQITIQFNSDISTVTIRDNGIGMDRQWIEKYFLKIGISLYQSREIRGVHTTSQIGLEFISQFGIGFLSSFLVAEKIRIKTRRAGASGLMITITDLRDYFDVRPLGDDTGAGTEVKLHLRPRKANYSRSMDYLGYLKSNIRFLRTPLTLHDERGQTHVIGGEALSYADPASADVDFIAPLAFSESEGYLLLKAKRHGDHLFALESAQGGISIFQDGIFVRQVASLLPEGARGNVVGRINLMGSEKCALSMDRNRIFWTEDQLGMMKSNIDHGLVTVANQLVAAVQSQKVSANTLRSITNHLATFFDVNRIDDDLHARLCPALRRIVEKRFRDFVRVHFAHALRTAGVQDGGGYTTRWQQAILRSFVRQ
jgi:hypothetical protein